MIIPVILCGGVGSRLWPLSRKTNPKQFISIMSKEDTLFDETLDRIKGSFFSSPIIVCNKEFEFKIRSSLKKINIKPEVIILEPEGRNTAPAISLAAIYALKNNIKGNLLILPADHHIKDVENFSQIVYEADKNMQEKIVTFGIEPLNPSTAYGYIKKSLRLSRDIFKVEKFIEKPDSKNARQYFKSGEYFWNSGIFLFSPKVFLEELKEHEKEIYGNSYNVFDKSKFLSDAIKVDCKSFSAVKNISIDYAILEKSLNVVMCPAKIDWSDVGSWNSVYKAGDKDKDGNLLDGDVVAIDSKNNFAHSRGKVLAMIDVQDLVIVSTEDAVLVANQASAEKVKDVVGILKKQKRKEHSDHLKVYRPWGYYQDIDQGKNYRVKRLTIYPGEKLSLQMHNQRSEHWVVVQGEASIVLGDKEEILKTGESTFVPVKVKHRLENKTNHLLEIVETQIGGYLGEDDIVRFADIYGRKV